MKMAGVFKKWLKKPKRRGFLFAILLCFPIISPAADGDATEGSPDDPRAWYQRVNPQWGGHLKTRGAASWYDDQTLYGTVGSNPYVDGSVEGRLKNQLFFGEWGQLETHYEVILYGGDTRGKNQELGQLFPNFDNILFIKIGTAFSQF